MGNAGRAATLSVKYYGIDTIDKANDFLREYLPRFNALFSVEACESAKRWHCKQVDDGELLFSVKSEHTAKSKRNLCLSWRKIPRKSAIQKVYALRVSYNRRKGFL